MGQRNKKDGNSGRRRSRGGGLKRRIRRIRKKWGLPLWLLVMLAAVAWGWQTGEWRPAIVVGALPIAEFLWALSS